MSPVTKYYSGEHIKKNEMGRACGEEMCIEGFGGEI
jgi:hypothetical protein